MTQRITAQEPDNAAKFAGSPRTLLATGSIPDFIGVAQGELPMLSGLACGELACGCQKQ
jgi:hypothetical protein